MRNYQEFTLASMLFFGMKEQSCSEQSARMTAMDGASKNAGMKKLDFKLVYTIDINTSYVQYTLSCVNQSIVYNINQNFFTQNF